MSTFATFVFDHVPPPPRRVLEVGCGSEGGLVGMLAERGYDALGVDPQAPAGERFVRADFRSLDGAWDVVVAGRVLHHLDPLGASLDHLASLAPLLLVDEFAANRLDGPAAGWYEQQHRMLRAAGADPPGPTEIAAWHERHPGLHGDELLLRELRARYDELALERVPYLHRWLEGPSSEALEQSLIDAGAFPAIGYRWAGVSRTSTTRSAADAR